MPEVEAKVETTTTGQAASETPESPSAESKPDERISMSKAEFSAFIEAQTKPWQEKYSNAEADLGRIKKHVSYDKETIERLANSEKNFESVKRLVTGLGIPQDKIKDAESIRDLELLLRGYEGTAKASSVNGGGQAKGESSSDLFTQFQEFLASRQNPNGNGDQRPKTEAFVSGRGTSSVTVTKDNIDKLEMEGKLPPGAYSRFRNGGTYDGPLPSL